MRCSSRRIVGRGEGGPEVFFRTQAFQAEEGEGQHRERDVVVPALPTTAFVVVQSELVFELLVALLDPPADLGDAYEARQVGRWREAGKPVAARDGLAG